MTVLKQCLVPIAGNFGCDGQMPYKSQSWTTLLQLWANAEKISSAHIAGAFVTRLTYVRAAQHHGPAKPVFGIGLSVYPLRSRSQVAT